MAKAIWQWIKAIAIAVFIAVLIRGFIFEPVYVEGVSMENTLRTGERLIVYKLGYYFKAPAKGDIIVLQVQTGNNLQSLPILGKLIPDLEEIDYIKRVIAVPGDTVFVRGKYVYVNNERLEEPYVPGGVTETEMAAPVTVPAEAVFVMGDNRQNSRDSREIGCIGYDRIKGKAVFRFLPLSRMGKVK